LPFSDDDEALAEIGESAEVEGAGLAEVEEAGSSVSEAGSSVSEAELDEDDDLK